MKGLGICILLILCSSIINGQTANTRRYTMTITDSKPSIDGRIDENEWHMATWSGDFTQHQPYEGAVPGQDTEFCIMMNDGNIFVAIRAYDSNPDSIITRMTRRDNISGDNVAVVFDSFFDRRTGFVFQVSSAGVKADYIMANDGESEEKNWNPVWDVKTAIYDWGWAAEMQIPLTQLRFDTKSGSQWGLQVARMIYRSHEMSFWEPIPRDAPGFIHLFGTLEGMVGIASKREIEVSPFSSISYEKYRPNSTNSFLDGSDFYLKAGVDGKIGITNNLTADFTVLPDFGQVESDPSEVNLTAYETYFEEQRPFFIEGKNIINFAVGPVFDNARMDNLFYSRRIGRKPQLPVNMYPGEVSSVPRETRIMGAFKVTGKTEGGISIGILEAMTAEERAEIDLDGERRFETVEPLTNYFISRVQKDFNRGQTIIGGMITNTIRNMEYTIPSLLHASATTGGFDFIRYWNRKTWEVSASASFSHVTGSKDAIAVTQRSSAHYFQRPDADHISFDPDATSLSGMSSKFEVGKIGGNLNLRSMTYVKTPGFEINDLGYVRRGDEILQVLYSRYSITKPFSIFRSARASSVLWGTWDFGGVMTSVKGLVSLNGEFRNQWSAYATMNFSDLITSNDLLRGGPSIRLPGGKGITMGVATGFDKKVSARVDAYYTRGAGNVSSNKTIKGGLTWRPTGAMNVSATSEYTNNLSQLQYVTRLVYNDEDRYVFAKLDQQIVKLSFRINYSFSPDISFQYWGQPFLSINEFESFKYITDPMAENYEDRFHNYSDEEISLNQLENRYYVDENLDGVNDYDFRYPTFNSNLFLSNLVFRWEYRPGSTLFFVWSQNRDYFNNTGEYDQWSSFSTLYSDIKPYNVFLIKLSYRFGVK